jgi:cobaltochelatase CobS
MRGAGLTEPQVRAIVDQEMAKRPDTLNENRVREIATEVASQHINRIQLIREDGAPGPTIEGAHAYLRVALSVTQLGIPLLLYGPKGTGKTTLAEQLAQALELSFGVVNCSGAMTAGKLVGFANPMNGEWLRGELTRHIDSATLVLIDEADAADPGVQLCMNSVLANRYIGEPSGIHRCHEDFVMVLATNTINGATREYNGRQKLDGALLDRCAILELHLDNAVEAACCGITEKSTLNGDPHRGGLYRNSAEWLADVRTARTALLAKGLVAAAPSPRAGKDGTRLLAQLGKYWLRELFLHRGGATDVRNIIDAELNKAY